MEAPKEDHYIGRLRRSVAMAEVMNVRAFKTTRAQR